MIKSLFFSFSISLSLSFYQLNLYWEIIALLFLGIILLCALKTSKWLCCLSVHCICFLHVCIKKRQRKAVCFGCLLCSLFSLLFVFVFVPFFASAQARLRAELKHISKRSEKKLTRIPLLAASEQGSNQQSTMLRRFLTDKARSDNLCLLHAFRVCWQGGIVAWHFFFSFYYSLFLFFYLRICVDK